MRKKGLPPSSLTGEASAGPLSKISHRVLVTMTMQAEGCPPPSLATPNRILGKK